eukprot:CAMPEP_0175957972 /NCGR_PEP_ID=MMETSP0108-20121206/33988_1 /TAXON_ID=195067 ORGANISM="Goniomonas pacifica, Strain CCMP1869" /NCGR_SAMPLE_ID=MMETSP0108 /ASSEMBLY_ACC=CAM_ASM_000204 /LENGTH=102 /DNA_ID=CAMNT_0017285273 /DNA_START=315 /DNA_END=620 /DNA_ORIENTATION=+
MPPEHTNSVLPADVPHPHCQVLVVHFLNIETDRWDRGNELIELEFVQDGSFPRSIEAKKEKTGLATAAKEFEKQEIQPENMFVVCCPAVGATAFLLLHLTST